MAKQLLGIRSTWEFRALVHGAKALVSLYRRPRIFASHVEKKNRFTATASISSEE
jgi:hypothetical protein